MELESESEMNTLICMIMERSEKIAKFLFGLKPQYMNVKSEDLITADGIIHFVINIGCNFLTEQGLQLRGNVTMREGISFTDYRILPEKEWGKFNVNF